MEKIFQEFPEIKNIEHSLNYQKELQDKIYPQLSFIRTLLPHQDFSRGFI
ncbi:MAG: hypothetical protein GXP45_00040 [bacterium]|nr:hypothetical protein [bacterium]